ncbi:hypothetical protein DPSP01_001676 [Paraphaeosphaeria sporulosa]|uniref:Calcium channel YVC1-like C-terminal transmembrane domain-containing protein n=1 Tax=Paraphaeosphaeria sporulosa TaxID=1460663 RepID=A0A177CTR6_9PLEO|nr:uncharacterized protein CC84DRAFT_1213499 [Paraphaeosphaeria sporulosa]OAG10139.1 hypothetical protein CC84DRAFT_1213499 [Paraphaeosphaeria sporulosa]
MSPSPMPRWHAGPQDIDVPRIDETDDLGELVRKLSFYIVEAITLPHSFEELRTAASARTLTPLILYLTESCHHRAIVHALLALKAHFAALEESSDEPGVNEARGYACEYVAWQFLTNLTERDTIDFLLHEIQPSASTRDRDSDIGREQENGIAPVTERSALLDDGRTSSYFGTDGVHGGMASSGQIDEFTAQFENLSALEIAAVSDSKKFLRQRPVQKIIDGLWRGDIVFWDTLGVNSVKEPKLYNRRRADPFCRLRVPRYLKIYETLYFAMFLILYYIVLTHRSSSHVTSAEALLYVWIAGFAYDEFGEFHDAGQVSFYTAGLWGAWDLSIVLIGIVFCALRIVGLSTKGEASRGTLDLAYDVLGLEALFLVPRIFALLSLNPYFGTLIPCLKEMTKDFVKFLSLVVILYLGFLTTFVLLARGTYTPSEMSWILIKVFFGSSYLGFDVAQQISPYFGPPVMLIFVALTNILLITSLVSLLSNSLSKVLDHARDEYLFIYSVYVLEASSSNRLTYYLPPLNLIPLLLRPLRLVLPSERLRSARIVILKATHLPFVGAIWTYEQLFSSQGRNSGALSMTGPEAARIRKGFFRSSIQPAQSLAAGFRASSGGSNGSSGRAPEFCPPRARDGPTDPDQQLKILVSKLSMQVEELTSIVSQLQEQREATVAT